MDHILLRSKIRTRSISPSFWWSQRGVLCPSALLWATWLITVVRVTVCAPALNKTQQGSNPGRAVQWLVPSGKPLTFSKPPFSLP
jgi:hypothetical protein